MITKNKQVVTDFIDMIWNKRHYDQLCMLLHSNFEDHSLPAALPFGAEGLKLWISGLGKSFEHTTRIDEMIAEGDKVAIRITMLLRHTGTWRGIEAPGREFATGGFRVFRLSNGKIIEHWGLLDPTTIENAIKA
jgi:predicted SnoaL-like aldol condensation-catalyzing enzyme